MKPTASNHSPAGNKSKYNSERESLTVQTDLDNTFDSRWAEVKISGKNISNRSNHAAVVCGNFMYVHGGYDVDKGIMADFHKIDISEDEKRSNDYSWVPLNNTHPQTKQPIKLKNHTAVAYKECIYIFGGEKNSAESSNETFVYSCAEDKWTELSSNITLPKIDSHCVTVHEGKMYLYGGYIPEKAELMADVYCLDLEKKQWEHMYASNKNKEEPEGRSNCDMVHYQGHLYIFGGSNGVNTLNDFWRLSVKGKSWEKIKTENTPSPRRGHSMVIYSRYLFMFAGIQDITKEKNDVYIYDFGSKNWRKIHTSTNSVYDCSPTLKREKKEAKSPEKLTLVKISPEKSSQGDAMKKILNENKQKKFQERKKELLKQFSEKANETSKPRSFSPTTESMLKTLEAIGNQESSRKETKQEIIYDESNRKIIGKKPCARDGQTICIKDDCMYIFGGDRHLMAFNDLYSFDLAKGIKSLELYSTKTSTRESRPEPAVKKEPEARQNKEAVMAKDEEVRKAEGKA